MQLRPLQGSTQHGPPTSQLPPLRRATEKATSATLMEFLSLRRVSPSESTPRRFATPTTFRPQGFAPSRRFSPRSNAQPCFMPVTPMGFQLSRDFPSLPGSTGSSPGNYPHGISPPHRKDNSALRGARFSANPIKSLRHEPLSPPGLCSDSESVPLLDCYIQNAPADSLLSFHHLSRVLPIVSRPCHVKHVPLVRLVHLFLRQPSSEQVRTDLRKGGVRFSGFARKRRISLRGAKNPLLRFLWPFRRSSLSEEQIIQCSMAYRALRPSTHGNRMSSSLLGQIEISPFGDVADVGQTEHHNAAQPKPT